MAVYVLLVRAIGPVTHRKMSMAALRDGLLAAGLADVSTVGNTGNVLCRSPKGAAAVKKFAQGVIDVFGLGAMCEVFVRTPAQMAEVVAANPFPNAALDHPARVGVCVFHEEPDWPGAITAHEGPEELATVGAHLIIDYPEAAGAMAVERLVGKRMTQRNWRVFASLADKAAAMAEARG